MYQVRVVEPSLLGVRIQPNSSLCGLQLSAVKVPEQCILLGLLRQRQVITFRENPSIYTEDIVLAMALHPMLTPALKVALKESHRIYYSLNDCLLKERICE